MLFRVPARLITAIIIFGIILTGCSAAPGAQTNANGKLNVVATTTLVGDVVANIGGDHINLSVLIPANVDEHGYEPTPQDAAKVARADLVFMNGVGLEQFIEKLMNNASGKAPLAAVSEGVPLLQGSMDAEVDEASMPEASTPAPKDTNQTLNSGDPHVWMDPNNVLIWIDNIEKALSTADPQHAAGYQKNAAAYRQQIKDLDAWTRQQTEQIPANRRKLVTDHLVFTYFAKRYGFEQVGAVVPGYSTMASPSAHELAALEDSIKKLKVQVIFVGNTVNPSLSERVAQDTHTQLVHILTGSLTDASGPAPTYIQYIQYNVNAIVKALK